MPVASTSATNVAIGGSTATGCAAAGTVVEDGPAAGATAMDGVIGAAAAAIAGRGSDNGGVVLVPRAAPVVLGVVRAAIGIEDDAEDVRWGLRVRTVVTVMTVVTARIEAAPRTAIRPQRQLTSERVLPSRRLRSVSDAPSRRGEAGPALSTMC
jgi:hypothetical protein